MDRPRNEMTCDDLVKCAVKIGQDLGVEVTVVSGEQLREQGFGGQFVTVVSIIGRGGDVTSPPPPIIQITIVIVAVSCLWLYGYCCIVVAIIYSPAAASYLTETTEVYGNFSSNHGNLVGAQPHAY